MLNLLRSRFTYLLFDKTVRRRRIGVLLVSTGILRFGRAKRSEIEEGGEFAHKRGQIFGMMKCSM
jgi:hypothetical protein